MPQAKDLTQVAPASPRVRTGGYALLARMADKGRATLAGTPGEYHFACPLDQMLFGFKGVAADDVKKLLASGANDEHATTRRRRTREPKSADEIKQWSDGVEAYRPYDDPEKKDWFAGVCQEVGLNPETSVLFDYLDTDDIKSFKK